MSLGPGARLGPYEILSALGAGGMGEVYRARDTRLDRTVAIKVLPAHVSGDLVLRERFEREARAIAALNHPHICTLHDVGRQDGIDFLVMEYLDGETLASRLAKGALPVDVALRHGIEIADALDKAHRAGIVHRDLKPGNIMLTKSGATLLDFGLAKVTPAAVATSGLSVAPTLQTPVTMQGTILGTLQYMAPEQIEGQGADARTDIFAFGAVLYEMLTGRQAFEGKTQASLIGAILKDTPASIASLQPLTPPALDRVISTCLAKDSDERWQTMRDLLRELKWVANTGAAAPVAPAATSPRRSRHRIAWGGAVIASLVAAAFALVLYGRRPASEPVLTRFEIQTPATSEPMSFALSPDGRSLAFVATADGASRLLIRPLDQVTSQTIAGTEDAIFPFWSPDGRTIAFFAGGKLKIVDVPGGSPRVLADAPSGRGGTWNRDGVVVFAPSTAAVLMRVPATGGTPAAVTRFATGQNSHRWPQFLPDGRRFLFEAAQGQKGAQGVFVGSLDGGEPTRVLDDETAVTYVPPGTLLVLRRGALVALSFDPARAAVIGDAMPVTQSVGWDATMVRGALAASSTGVLAYRTGLAVRRQLAWVDRTGTVRGIVGPADENAPAGPELSPDGRRAAIFRTVEGNTDVWLLDVARGVPSRFTFEDHVDFFPVWSPDGQRIVFGSNRNGTYDFFEKSASGVGEEKPLLGQLTALPMAISSDGRFLLYGAQVPKTGVDLWALPLTGDRKPFPVVLTPFDEMAGQFSPDGRWVAYQSNESGRVEVYVRPFPGPGGQSQVSQAGGTQARWRPDGKELFYVAPDSRLMAVGVTPDGQSIDAGPPVPLFVTRLATGMNVYPAVGTKPQYAVAPDGRFLMNMPVEGSTAPPITVVLNWEAALKK